MKKLIDIDIAFLQRQNWKIKLLIDGLWLASFPVREQSVIKYCN